MRANAIGALAAGPVQAVTGSQTMSLIRTIWLGLLASSAAMIIAAAPAAAAAETKHSCYYG
jgi:hypothetical protein